MARNRARYRLRHCGERRPPIFIFLIFSHLPSPSPPHTANQLHWLHSSLLQMRSFIKMQSEVLFIIERCRPFRLFFSLLFRLVGYFFFIAAKLFPRILVIYILQSCSIFRSIRRRFLFHKKKTMARVRRMHFAFHFWHARQYNIASGFKLKSNVQIGFCFSLSSLPPSLSYRLRRQTRLPSATSFFFVHQSPSNERVQCSLLNHGREWNGRRKVFSLSPCYRIPITTILARKNINKCWKRMRKAAINGN